MRPILIGESNPYGPGPEYALWPEPAGSAGHLLCHRVLGLGADEYLERFARANLCAGPWCLAEARIAAASLRHPRAILLGARVCRAHEVEYEPFATAAIGGRRIGLVLPHPSGRCRAWNDSGAIARARASVAKFLGE